MIISQTPMRMSFAGGGSDFPSFYQRYGGAVVSTQGLSVGRSGLSLLYITSWRRWICTQLPLAWPPLAALAISSGELYLAWNFFR